MTSKSVQRRTVQGWTVYSDSEMFGYCCYLIVGKYFIQYLWQRNIKMKQTKNNWVIKSESAKEKKSSPRRRTEMCHKLPRIFLSVRKRWIFLYFPPLSLRSWDEFILLVLLSTNLFFFKWTTTFVVGWFWWELDPLLNNGRMLEHTASFLHHKIYTPWGIIKFSYK